MGGASFEFDLSRFRRQLAQAPVAVRAGATHGLNKSARNLQRKAVNRAPVKTGHLAGAIEAQEASGGELEALVTSEAISSSSGYGSFNYAYYIHEVSNGQLKKAGAIHKYIEQPLKESESTYQRFIEESIMRELRNKGFNIS